MTIDFKNDIKKASQLLKSGNLSKYQEIELDKIELDPNQPRKEFDSESLKQLSESIATVGVLQPITIRPIENEKFILCFGERRFRASQYLKNETIPAIIINTDENMLEKQLIENVQRSDLSHEEIADSIKVLIDVKKMKKKDVAKLLSKSNAYVGNYYAFSKMAYIIRNMLQEKTNDITLIIEINKIIEDVKEEDNKQRILAYIEEQVSINRNTPKTIKELFLEKNIETIDDENEESSVTQNENTFSNNESKNSSLNDISSYGNDSSNSDKQDTDIESEINKFDDEDYCNDYNDDEDDKPNSTPKNKDMVSDEEETGNDDIEDVKIPKRTKCRYDYDNYAFLDDNLEPFITLDKEFAETLTEEKIDMFKEFIIKNIY